MTTPEGGAGMWPQNFIDWLNRRRPVLEERFADELARNSGTDPLPLPRRADYRLVANHVMLFDLEGKFTAERMASAKEVPESDFTQRLLEIVRPYLLRRCFKLPWAVQQLGALPPDASALLTGVYRDLKTPEELVAQLPHLGLAAADVVPAAAELLVLFLTPTAEDVNVKKRSDSGPSGSGGDHEPSSGGLS